MSAQRKYAGVGSRKTPAVVLERMRRTARNLAKAGWILRSGGAEGADTAFARGHADAVKTSNLEIFVPWDGYRTGSGHAGTVLRPELMARATEMAAEVHPNWAACRSGARKLHARNVAIILGADLDDPVENVLCWTPGGRGEGGTGLAIRLAHKLGIAVTDIGAEEGAGAAAPSAWEQYQRQQSR